MKMNMTPRAKKLLAGLTAAALTLSMLPATALAAKDYATGGETALRFSNSGITVQEGDYDGYKIDGTELTINAAGTYVLSGSCADGSVTVKKGTTGVVLVLDGLTLTCGDSAAIACNKSTEVTIVAADGTVNTLADTEQNNDETYPDNDSAENAVIKCKDGSQVTLCGSGTLNVTANGKNGVKSGATTDEEGAASLTIRELTLNIDAPVNDAVNAEQQLNIESGSLTISAGDDALHCDLSLTVGASGTAGPDIDITGCYEGIEAANLAIRSGDIDITATDDCLNAANSDLTGYSFTMDISGSTINAYTSGGDGFDSNGSLTISGGVIAVWTANTADNQPLDADGTITVSGGTVLAAGGSSGMGMNLSASQPYVLYGSTGGMGGGRGQGQQSALAAKGSTLTIQDASGNSVYSAAAPCNVNFAFFSSPKLTLGSSYTLTGGSTTTTATAQTGTTTSNQPGGGQRPDGTGSGTGGQRPSAPADGQQPTPPDGTQQPADGTTPPEKPDGSGDNGASGGNAQQPGPGGFTDVSRDDWFANGVDYVSQKGLMSGTGTGTFAPNTALTRGMLVTILYQMAGAPEVTGTCPFRDVAAGSYYEKAAIWAVENGLVSGYENGCFGPNDPVTREQLAAILYRYAQYRGLDVSQTGSIGGFADNSSVSGYARTAMAWANGAGLISGMGDNTLAPRGTATRGQAAVILMGLDKLAGL